MAKESAVGREQLVGLWKRFVDGFNRNDIESVMSMFTDDAVVQNSNGSQCAGKSEIRVFLAPYFKGDLGTMHFVDDDLVADLEMRKLTATWRLTLTLKGASSSFRGVDILQFVNDKIAYNKVYIKGKEPVLE